MIRCGILDDYQDVARRMADWDSLPDCEVHVFTKHVAERDALVAALQPFEVLVAMRERTRFDRALFERLPRLKLLVTTGMRNAAIDLKAAADRGVLVCGTEGSGAAAAELTWGLVLALLRHIPLEAGQFSRGGWQTSVGRELAGKRLGIVGFGRLGRRVARYGTAFEMRVSAWSRSLTPAQAAEHGVEACASLEDLLRSADIITLHVTLNPGTRGLIGARELAFMKPSAVLVNTARGPVVDEAALVAALRERRIAGAALDVFDEEPLPPAHPLRTLDNVVATPHLGYVTEETYRVFYGEAVEDVRSWLAGTPIRVLR
jgi:phosphoglycerate dehydrogenase-like enzyme